MQINQSKQAFNTAASTHWVVVTNQAECTIYEQQPATKLLVKRFEFRNPEARMKSSELASDRDGRSFDSVGVGRHAMSKEPDTKKQRNIEKFVAEIATTLKTEYHAGHYKHLSIIAAPAFMGMLRNAIGSFRIAGNFRTISKDLVTQDEALINTILARK